MIRIRDKIGKQLEYLLTWLQDHEEFKKDFGETNPTEYLDNLITSGALTRVQRNQLKDLNGEDPSRDLTSLTKELLGTFNGDQEKDLLQSLASLLRNTGVVNGGRQVLSGYTLTLLRNTLLGNGDANLILERLQTRPLSCVGCGHKFVEQEMGTIYQDAQTRSLGIFCSRCISPESMACGKGGCDQMIAIPGKIYRELRNARTNLCRDHQVEQAQRAQNANPDMVGILEGDPPEMENQWLDINAPPMPNFNERAFGGRVPAAVDVLRRAQRDRFGEPR